MWIEELDPSAGERMLVVAKGRPVAQKKSKNQKILRSSPLQVDGNPARGSLSCSQVFKILTGSKVITENEKEKKKCRGPAGR